MSTIALFIMSTGLSLHLYASNVIYRWVDKNNVVHFSQHQPEHDNYTTLNISAQNKTKRAIQLPKPTESAINTPVTIEENSEEKAEQINTTVNSRCEEAKQNLETLTSFEIVQYIDEQGGAKVLSDEDKIKQRALAKQQIDTYCQ